MRDIEETTQQFVVANAAQKALQKGDKASLLKAVVIAHEKATTTVTKNIADRALGFKEE